jgi:hypothetical protein
MLEQVLGLLEAAKGSDKLGMSLQPLEGLSVMMTALAAEAQERAQAVASS